jgi:hypothetical protein
VSLKHAKRTVNAMTAKLVAFANMEPAEDTMKFRYNCRLSPDFVMLSNAKLAKSAVKI